MKRGKARARVVAERNYLEDEAILLKERLRVAKSECTIYKNKYETLLNKAIEHNCGQYNPQTGEFEWKGGDRWIERN